VTGAPTPARLRRHALLTQVLLEADEHFTDAAHSSQYRSCVSNGLVLQFEQLWELALADLHERDLALVTVNQRVEGFCLN
jgi:hypothetical protein